MRSKFSSQMSEMSGWRLLYSRVRPPSIASASVSVSVRTRSMRPMFDCSLAAKNRVIVRRGSGLIWCGSLFIWTAAWVL